MSFLPSLSSLATSGTAEATADPHKLQITVTPLRPSTFAGDVFQAKISFRCAAPAPTAPTPPSTFSFLPKLGSSSDTTALPLRPPSTPSRTFTPTHRAVQSLSLAGSNGAAPWTAGPTMMEGRDGSSLPAGYTSTAAFAAGRHGATEIPPRRGVIGKRRPPSHPNASQPPDVGSPSKSRSISASDFMIDRTSKDEDLNSLLLLKGKGKARALSSVRSQSISALPAGLGLTSMGDKTLPGSPLRSAFPDALDTPPSTPARTTARSSPSALPPAHPHARKPSYAPNGFHPTTTASSSRLNHSTLSSPVLKTPPLPSISESSGYDAESSDVPPMTPLDDAFSRELELPPLESAWVQTPSTPAASSPARPDLASRPSSVSRASHRIGLGRPSSFHQTDSDNGPALASEAASPSGLTITWSYVHLVATLVPSPQYLSPESLLPLRHTLLQSSSVGSGTLPSRHASTSASSLAPSSWFSLPPPPRNASAPSLTSSLFGLAKGVWGGVGGSSQSTLQEQRRKMWESSVKEVPVFETLKSVMGVDVELGMKAEVGRSEDGVDYIYSIPLPSSLPPTFAGKALKISYNLVIGVEVEHPLRPLQPGEDPFAPRRRERFSRILRVPVRIFGGVDESGSIAREGYDLMRPVIQKTVEAQLVKVVPDLTPSEPPKDVDKDLDAFLPSSEASFKSYALHLLSALSPPAPPPLPLPPTSLPPRTPPRPNHAHKHTRSQVLSPNSHSALLPEIAGDRSSKTSSSSSGASEGKGKIRSLDGTRIGGRAELGLEDDEDGSEEILEGLLRGSQKVSYDIEKEGQVVAVFTLVKSAHRLGETVLGVVTFNALNTFRRVLKFSAFLQTHEVIPSALQSPTGPPLLPLRRTHADHHSSMVQHTARLPFSLDIPSAGVPGVSPSFVLRAGTGTKEGKTVRPGGVEWKIRLSFLVSVPIKGADTTLSPPTHLIPVTPEEGSDPGHHPHHPSSSISPVVAVQSSLSRTPRFQPSSLPPSSSSSSSLYAASGEQPSSEYPSNEKNLSPLSADASSHDADSTARWVEMRTEVVECDVPITIFPPSPMGIGVADSHWDEGTKFEI